MGRREPRPQTLLSGCRGGVQRPRNTPKRHPKRTRNAPKRHPRVHNPWQAGCKHGRPAVGRVGDGWSGPVPNRCGGRGSRGAFVLPDRPDSARWVPAGVRAGSAGVVHTRCPRPDSCPGRRVRQAPAQRRRPGGTVQPGADCRPPAGHQAADTALVAAWPRVAPVQRSSPSARRTRATAPRPRIGPHADFARPPGHRQSTVATPAHGTTTRPHHHRREAARAPRHRRQHGCKTTPNNSREAEKAGRSAGTTSHQPERHLHRNTTDMARPRMSIYVLYRQSWMTPSRGYRTLPAVSPGRGWAS